jgi:hypothetical protein
MRKTTLAIVMLVGISASSLPAQAQTESQLSTAAVAPAPNAACAGCGGQACHPQGCIFRKLFVWATYCPKTRLGCCHKCCNSCQYKGVEPPYLFFLNPKCIEGSGVSATFPNQCYRGCNGCAVGHP